MSFVELLFLAIGLAMDAFSISVCKGLAAKKAGIPQMMAAGAWFGGSQMLMPLAGWLLGSRFRSYIEKVDHWIAFALLVLIGLNMIREAVFPADGGQSSSFSPKVMLMLAIATSIDALVVGITLGLLYDSPGGIVSASAFIGAVTFVLSAAGVKIGKVAGSKLGRPAEVAGGLILVLIGTKILLEHLGLLPF